MSQTYISEKILEWELSIRNPQKKLQLESIFRDFVLSNNLFSKKDIAERLKKSVVTVYFIPTSQGYINYGELATIVSISKHEIIDENYGLFVCDISTEENIVTVILDTRDIYKITFSS